ncbi:MAG: class I SAM-dependent methyltransferase [Brevinematia bacterium]
MNCSICKGSDLSFFLRSNVFGFNVYSCNSCGMVFRFPMPSKDELERFYDEGYYSGKNVYSYLDERNVLGSEFVWRERLKKIIKLYELENHRKPSTILDVGCSFGGFLKVSASFGLEPYGVEVSKYSSEYAQSIGIKVIQGNIEDVYIGSEMFDIITMIEVIEHLSDPLKVMSDIYSANTKGGIVLVQTANIEGLQSRFWGGNYHYYLPGHLHYFSNKTLRNLLFKVGYRKVYEFYPVEFGLLPKVVKSFLNNKGLYRWIKVFKTIVYHLLGKVKIGDLTLMSSMVMVGVK